MDIWANEKASAKCLDNITQIATNAADDAAVVVTLCALPSLLVFFFISCNGTIGQKFLGHFFLNVCFASAIWCIIA